MSIDMLITKPSLSRLRSVAAPLSVILLGVVLLVAFGRQTFRLPLLADHCIKTSKSVEVAYNLVRYNDFLNEYDDWKAVPQNPLGKQRSILRYESPLSAVLLGTTYLVVDGKNFDTRIAAARIFTLVHLAAAYLLFAVLVFRKELLSLTVFTFLLIGSHFTVSYATKPLAETYALLYQALLMVVATLLLKSEIAVLKKAAVLAGLTALLCLGGKMNYFLVAFPLMLGYPFLDKRAATLKTVLVYFAPFVGVAVLGTVVLLLFTEFSFNNAFVYMIRGNKPMLDDSLWATFKEGFDYWPAILKRTRKDFGTVVFDWGRYALVYLAAKFIYCLVAARKRPLCLHERFAAVLFLIVLGHALNYVVLRNLFIPHRYYVVPIFTVFCLSLTVAVGDLVRVIRGAAGPGKLRIPKKLIFLKPSPVFLTFFTLIGAALAAAGATWYYSYTLASPEFRTTAIYALKGLGHGGLAIDIAGQLARAAWGFRVISFILLICSALLTAGYFFLRKRTLMDRLFRRIQSVVHPVGTTPVVVVFMLLLLLPGWDVAFQNARNFYEYAASHVEFIEASEQLAVIRKDTVSGDLVLAWKPCYAFYADKRSILEPTQEDVSYYIKNDIHSLMGPVKPFHKYYKEIEKYPPPMSYWAPKAAKNTQTTSSQRKKKNQDQ